MKIFPSRLRWWFLTKRYEFECYMGHHITYDLVNKFEQKWKPFSFGGPKNIHRIKNAVRPIRNCRRCEKIVNVGLDDDHFLRVNG